MSDSDWASLPDEQLLGVRMSDLDLTIEGTEVEQRIAQLNAELEARGLAPPRYWLSDEWFTPDGVPGIAIPFTGAPSTFGVSLQGKVYLKPGTVTTVAIDKKSFKGTSTRITITGVRIKTDQCAGQSFIRSYATLTSSTDNTDDVITYLGVTKAV